MTPTGPHPAFLAACLLAAPSACTSPHEPGPTDPPTRPAAPAQLTLEQIRAEHPFPRLVLLSEDQLEREEDGGSRIGRFFEAQFSSPDPPQAFELWVPTELESSTNDHVRRAFASAKMPRRNRYAFLHWREVEYPDVTWSVETWGLRPALVCTISVEYPGLREKATRALDSAGIPTGWRFRSDPWDEEEAIDWPHAYLRAPVSLRSVAGEILSEVDGLKIEHYGRARTMPADGRLNANGHMRLLVREPEELHSILLDWPNPLAFPGEAHAVEMLFPLRHWPEVELRLWFPPTVGFEYSIGFLPGADSELNPLPGFGRLCFLDFEQVRVDDLFPEPWFPSARLGIYPSPVVGVAWREGLQFGGDVFRHSISVPKLDARRLERARDRDLAGLPARPVFHPPFPIDAGSPTHRHHDRRIVRIDLPGYDQHLESNADRVQSLIDELQALRADQPPPQAIEILSRRRRHEQDRELLEQALASSPARLEFYRFSGPVEAFACVPDELVILRYLLDPAPLARFGPNPKRTSLGEAAALLWERWIPFGWHEDETGAVLEVPRDLVETAASLLEAEPHLAQAILGPW